MPSEMTVSLLPSSERAALVNFLDAQRVGLVRKIEDVADDQARRAPTASSLSLLGLVKHSTTWEQRWFEVVLAGRSVADGWPEVAPVPGEPDSPADVPADFTVAEDDTVADRIVAYRAQWAISDAIIHATELDAPGLRPDIIECNLRYVLLHLIEETARHAGHADIIRETLDGARGI